MYEDYDDDYDYYYEEDESDNLKGTSYEEFLCKAWNGHLFITTVYGWCYWGQDWGETVGQWETKYYNIREWNDDLIKTFIDAGRSIAPNESIPIQSILPL